MLKSMAGYGRSRYEIDGRTYIIEIKSVNHKYNDLTVKMPRFLNPLEDKIRKTVSESISRGKIDVYINFQNYSDKGKNIKVNTELAKVYIGELQRLADETGIVNNINVIDISKFPEILNIEDENDLDLIWGELKISLEEAISNFVEMRTIEGNKMALDIKSRLDSIAGIVAEITEYSATVVEDYIAKLETRVKELMKTDVVDETRLAQEIVIYSHKSSIEEELTRLRTHISHFHTLLQQDNAIGKKMDFLVQEMNREVNTIGSKANSLDITNRVILIKTEIENIREQIQNIE